MIYKIHFIDGTSVDVGRDYIERLAGGIDTIQKTLIDSNKNIWCNYSNITYIEKTEKLEGNSGIVTPPEPQELRKKEQEEEAKKTENLNATLATVKQEQSPDTPAQ